jgi:hypothetical protein
MVDLLHGQAVALPASLAPHGHSPNDERCADDEEDGSREHQGDGDESPQIGP